MKWPLILALAFLVACGPPPPQGPPDPLAQGQKIYLTRCRTCHQADGSGTIRNNRFAADFTDPNGFVTRSDEELRNAVLNGVEGRYGRMPSFRPILSDEDITQVLAYIRKNFAPQVEEN